MSTTQNQQPNPICPQCGCKHTVKKGKRRNRLQVHQVFKCTECLRRFTGEPGKNKTYQLKIILESISTFNLGYSLTETQQLQRQRFHRSIPERTISSWLTEPLTTYSRLRTDGKKLFAPETIIQTINFDHQQIYRHQIHRAKLKILLESPLHNAFTPLTKYLEGLKTNFPNHFFQAAQHRSSKFPADAADHGHVLLPEIAPGSIAHQPPEEWKMVKRRSLLGSSISRSPGVTIMQAPHLGITGPVKEYAAPISLTAFVAGHGYFHEGLSLQECLVPVVVLKARGVRPVGSGREEVEIRYRSDRFTSRVVGVKVWFNSLLSDSLTVRVEAYDGSGPKAKLVGEAADCEARDPATRLVTLNKGTETQVPVRIQDDFTGANVEIRATDAATGAVFHRLKLKSSIME